MCAWSWSPSAVVSGLSSSSLSSSESFFRDTLASALIILSRKGRSALSATSLSLQADCLSELVFESSMCGIYEVSASLNLAYVLPTLAVVSTDSCEIGVSLGHPAKSSWSSASVDTAISSGNPSLSVVVELLTFCSSVLKTFFQS